MINDSTINKLDEAINEADHVTYETSIQEKGTEKFKLCFYVYNIILIICKCYAKFYIIYTR